ncbi:MAG: hypothetical protein PHH24_01780 [Candidatus Moranbacteria bacterium]|nr:hypothetical protein [Candidatus Moranbacteria bacterium]MDD5652039.1 hypothetical protein [Candidatus Moranbacteria bacterium]MDX9855293.1 hypothetical protein [Candidatus Moranbacteria bacterium]
MQFSEEDKIFIWKVVMVFFEESRKFEDFILENAKGAMKKWPIKSITSPGIIRIDRSSAVTLLESKIKAYYLGRQFEEEIRERVDLPKEEIMVRISRKRSGIDIRLRLKNEDGLRIAEISAKRKQR